MLPARLQFPPSGRSAPAIRPVVPVVRLRGAIGAVMPLRSGLAMANVAPLLERAFSVPAREGRRARHQLAGRIGRRSRI